MIDSRAARVLSEDSREMIDEEEWEWIEEHTRGSFDHLIIASTLPVFMAHGIHHLESWNEAVCGGVWGRRASQLGEKLRRAVDLEHWPAFHDSFERLVDLLRTVSNGNDGDPPATLILLGGDVHTAYIAQVELAGKAGPTRVFQLVCSPFRNPLSPAERRVIRWTSSSFAVAVFSRLARLCNVSRPSARWRFVAGPTFENSIGELELNAEKARVTIRCSNLEKRHPLLTTLHSRELAPGRTPTQSESGPARVLAGGFALLDNAAPPSRLAAATFDQRLEPC